MGHDCCTAVEHMIDFQEVSGSNRALIGPLFLAKISGVFLNQVPQRPFFNFRREIISVEITFLAVILGAKYTKHAGNG